MDPTFDTISSKVSLDGCTISTPVKKKSLRQLLRLCSGTRQNQQFSVTCVEPVGRKNVRCGSKSGIPVIEIESDVIQ